MLSREMQQRGFRSGEKLDIDELYVLMVGIFESSALYRPGMEVVPVYAGQSQQRELARLYIDPDVQQIQVLHSPAEDQKQSSDRRTPTLKNVREAVTRVLLDSKYQDYSVHRHYPIAQVGNKHYVYGYQSPQGELMIRDSLVSLRGRYDRLETYHLLGLTEAQKKTVDSVNHYRQFTNWQCGYYAAYELERKLSEISGNKVDYKDPFSGTSNREVLNSFRKPFDLVAKQFVDQAIESDSEAIDMSFDEDDLAGLKVASAKVTQPPKSKITPAMIGAFIGLGIIALAGIAAIIAINIVTGGIAAPALIGGAAVAYSSGITTAVGGIAAVTGFASGSVALTAAVSAVGVVASAAFIGMASLAGLAISKVKSKLTVATSVPEETKPLLRASKLRLDNQENSSAIIEAKKSLTQSAYLGGSLFAPPKKKTEYEYRQAIFNCLQSDEKTLYGMLQAKEYTDNEAINWLLVKLNSCNDQKYNFDDESKTSSFQLKDHHKLGGLLIAYRSNYRDKVDEHVESFVREHDEGLWQVPQKK